MIELPSFQFDRFLKPILASRFLTISAVVHLFLILLLGRMVLFNKYVEPPDFTSNGDGMVSTDTAAPPAPEPAAALPPTSTDPASNAPPPPAAPSMMALVSLNPSAATFSVPMPAIAPPTIGKDVAAQMAPQTNSAPVTLPPAMAQRQAAKRVATGHRFGEKAPAEQAVSRALQWLQTQQAADGTWGSGVYKEGYTGLALLCYLGHGETPQTSRDFSVVVSNAINALVAEGQQQEGRFAPGGNLKKGNETAYEHAICTYALSEAYTMTKDPRLEPLVRQAVDIIVKGQREDGGWTYKYDTAPDKPKEREYKSDTSVSGWQIQALKAAHLTGIDGMEQTVRPVLDNAMKNMDRVFNPQDGTYGYRVSGDTFDAKTNARRHNLTGVGVLSKLFWLGRVDRDTRAAIKDIQSTAMNYNGPDADIYAWYYDTQACFQAQGSAWDWWNSRFQDMLTSAQTTDGSWPPVGAKSGPGDMNNSAAGDGPIYRTTLCCLMLEVFYRYLPTSEGGGMQSGNVEGL